MSKVIWHLYNSLPFTTVVGAIHKALTLQNLTWSTLLFMHCTCYWPAFSHSCQCWSLLKRIDLSVMVCYACSFFKILYLGEQWLCVLLVHPLAASLLTARFTPQTAAAAQVHLHPLPVPPTADKSCWVNKHIHTSLSTRLALLCYCMWVIVEGRGVRRCEWWCQLYLQSQELTKCTGHGPTISCMSCMSLLREESLHLALSLSLSPCIGRLTSVHHNVQLPRCDWGP